MLSCIKKIQIQIAAFCPVKIRKEEIKVKRSIYWCKGDEVMVPKYSLSLWSWVQHPSSITGSKEQLCSQVKTSPTEVSYTIFLFIYRPMLVFVRFVRS